MQRTSHSISRLLTAFLFALVLLLPAADSMARGGGGFSGGRSSFSSSRGSSSWGSSSRSSGWGSSSSSVARPPTSAPSSSSSGWGSSTSSRSGAPSSAADNALSSKVNRAGTTSSRGSMITTRQQSTAQSIPSGAQTQWSSEPSARPSYVPSGATLGDGRYASVYYDPTYRNYGYWDSMGRWMMWSAILNSGSRNYYYESSPGYYGGQPSMAYGGGYGASRGSSFLSTMMGIVLIGALIAVGMYFYYKHSAEVEEQYNQPQAGYMYAANTQPRTSQRVPVPTARSANLSPWLNFPAGSFITLSDNQSMEDSQKRGEGFKGIRYAVESTAIADDTEGFASWAMITLDDQHQKLLLVVKSVDNEIDHRIYYANEQFRAARREDVVNRGDLWLFEAPEDENNFDPADLEYSAEIAQKNDSGELTYVRKDQGERHADYSETPIRSGAKDLVATIVEYSSSESAENPELLVLEIGAASRRTGEVTMYLGCAIKESEIDVLKA